MIVSGLSKSNLKFQFKYRKLLIANALVLFADGAQICAAGLIACAGEFCENEIESEGLCHVTVYDGAIDATVIDQKRYRMLVATDYFAPYRVVLPRLTKEAVKEMPFQQGIVKLNSVYKKQPPKPNYLSGNELYDVSCLLNADEQKKLEYINDEGEIELSKKVIDITKSNWAYQKKMRVNEKQLEALKLALTTELALIQGPPGTGKTFIALEIIKVLLNNQDNWRGKKQDTGRLDKRSQKIYDDKRAPIVIICFTNHALDEMLRKLVKDKICSKKDIVRLGRRCNEPELEGCLIHEIREEWRALGFEFNDETDKKAHEVAGERGSAIKVLKTMIIKLESIRNGLPTFEQLFEHNLPLKKKMLDVIKQSLKVDGWNIAKSDKGSMFSNWINPEKKYFKRIPLPRFYNRNEVSADADDREDLEAENDIEFMPFWKLRMSHWRSKPGTSDKLKYGSDHETYFASIVDRPFDELVGFFRNEQNRLKYFGYLKKIAMKKIQEEIVMFSRKLELCNVEAADVRNLKDAEICRDRLILGMTSTAAARCSGLLKTLGSKIILTEEASEVLESHTIASLTKVCEHFIMIGDHQQLRPKPANDNFAYQKQLNIPLFERLITNGFKSIRLDDQRRMRPEISMYPRTVFYKGMTDNLVVFRQPKPTSLRGNVFFMDYNKGRHVKIREQQPENSNSKTNPYEANFAVHLAWFFVRSGYKPSQVTILSYYGAQIRVLRECLEGVQAPRDSKFNPSGIEIKTVDNFQGQENEIVIISTVRSNERNSAGFTSNPNRTNVALSRAKQAMIVLGDFEMLAKDKRKANPWRDIRTVASKQGNLTDGALRIGCSRHQGPNSQKTIDITQPLDLLKHFPKGGCTAKCNGKLKCGHKCTWTCHDPKYHEDDSVIKCMKPCNKACKRGHRTCKQECYLPCQPCQVLIDREDSDIEKHILKKCDHKDKIPCGSGFMWRCEVKVKKALKCGHEGIFPCGARHFELRCSQVGCCWYNRISYDTPKSLDMIRTAEYLDRADWLANDIMKQINRNNVNEVGFNVQWLRANRAALISISCYTDIGIQNYLFRTCHFDVERCEPLMKILKSKEIVKVGLGIRANLARVAEETDFSVQDGAFVELEVLYHAYTEELGLHSKWDSRKYVHEFLKRLPYSFQKSVKDVGFVAEETNWYVPRGKLNSHQLFHAADEVQTSLQIVAHVNDKLGDFRAQEIIEKCIGKVNILKPKKVKATEDYDDLDDLQERMENLELQSYNSDWFTHIKSFDEPKLEEIQYADTMEKANEYAKEILEYVEAYNVPFVGMDAEWLNDNPICLIQISCFDQENESGIANYLFRSSKFDIYKCEPLMKILTSDDILKVGVEVDSDLKRLAYEKPPVSLVVENGAFVDLYSLTLQRGERTPGLKRLVKDYCNRDLGKSTRRCVHLFLIRQNVPSFRLGG